MKRTFLVFSTHLNHEKFLFDFKGFQLRQMYCLFGFDHILNFFTEISDPDFFLRHYLKNH